MARVWRCNRQTGASVPAGGHLRAGLYASLDQRILVIDGAMGTSIQALRLSEADIRGTRFGDHPQDLLGNNDLLSLTRPELIGAIHRSFLDAGADLVCTNTFNANVISQADYGTESCAREINLLPTATRARRHSRRSWRSP